MAFGSFETGSANSPTNRRLSCVTKVICSRFAGNTLFETNSAISISSVFGVSNRLCANVVFPQPSNRHSKQLCERYLAEFLPGSRGNDKPLLTSRRLEK